MYKVLYSTVMHDVRRRPAQRPRRGATMTKNDWLDYRIILPIDPVIVRSLLRATLALTVARSYRKNCALTAAGKASPSMEKQT